MLALMTASATALCADQAAKLVETGILCAAGVTMEQVTGQMVLIGTAVCRRSSGTIAKGARCPLISVVDCERLALDGGDQPYLRQDGFDAGQLLGDTLADAGWSDVTIHTCIPVADKIDGWEPELEALIRTAGTVGFAHMVLEPEAEATILH